MAMLTYVRGAERMITAARVAADGIYVRFADERYRESAEAAAARGRLVLGERLRALRSERGETQNGLAQRAGVNRASIARIEAGDQLPRYRTLVALANALDVSLDRPPRGGDDGANRDG